MTFFIAPSWNGKSYRLRINKSYGTNRTIQSIGPESFGMLKNIGFFSFLKIDETEYFYGVVIMDI